MCERILDPVTRYVPPLAPALKQKQNPTPTGAGLIFVKTAYDQPFSASYCFRNSTRASTPSLGMAL